MGEKEKEQEEPRDISSVDEGHISEMCIRDRTYCTQIQLGNKLWKADGSAGR